MQQAEVKREGEVVSILVSATFLNRSGGTKYSLLEIWEHYVSGPILCQCRILFSLNKLDSRSTSGPVRISTSLNNEEGFWICGFCTRLSFSISKSGTNGPKIWHEHFHINRGTRSSSYAVYYLFLQCSSISYALNCRLDGFTRNVWTRFKWFKNME